MRIFFALIPDAETRVRLSGAASELKLAEGARAVADYNLHITATFVGDVSDRVLDILRDTGTRLRLRRCAIELDSFEYWSDSRTIVLAARNNTMEIVEQVNVLRAAVAQVTRPRYDDSPWRAHVTLARKVTQAAALPAIPPFSWVSRSFSLLRSTTDGDLSVYTVVGSWPLLDKT